MKPVPDDPQAAFELGVTRGRRGCMVALLLAAALLAGLLYVAFRMLVQQRFGPIAQGEGWVAFIRTVEVGIDRDTYVYLGRSVDDEDTWHLLAPTDTVATARFEWVTAKHLRIAAWPGPPRRGQEQVEDIRIEWTQY